MKGESIAPIAGIKSIPILLSPSKKLDPHVSNFLKDKRIPISYIVGGTSALDDAVASSVPNSMRLSGTNRYLTNESINMGFSGDLDFDTVYVATGMDFPDALSGSVLAAKNKAPIILTAKDSISATTLELMKNKNVKKVVILGGTSVVNESVEKAINKVVSSNVDSPTRITLDKETANLFVGSSMLLTATVDPLGPEDTPIGLQWGTSDASVATVDITGKVTALKSGNATITVTTVDGNLTAMCDITVKGKAIEVESVRLNKTELTLNVGANDNDNLAATISPQNATNQNINWTTSNPLVATVDQSGKVMAVSGG